MRTTGESVLALLDRLTRQAGKNLIMVTHSADSAMWADRVFHLRDGQLEYDPSFERGFATASTKTAQHAHGETSTRP